MRNPVKQVGSCSGEVRSDAYVDIQAAAREVIRQIGYTKSDYRFDYASCGILSAIHEQSGDINQGVVRADSDNQGAGDQGMMFGYACNETRELMPATLTLAHVILKELADIRREGSDVLPLPTPKSGDVESPTTARPQRVQPIVVSTSTTISTTAKGSSREMYARF